MPQKTAFIYHPDYLNHDTGPEHPERPERLIASLAALQQSAVWEQLHHIDPTPATVEQIAYAHNPGYSEHIQQFCEAEIPLTYDTIVGHESYEIRPAFNRWGVICSGSSRNKESEKCFCDGASTRTPRHTRTEHGILLVQQHCRHSTVSST